MRHTWDTVQVGTTNGTTDAEKDKAEEERQAEIVKSYKVLIQSVASLYDNAIPNKLAMTVKLHFLLSKLRPEPIA